MSQVRANTDAFSVASPDGQHPLAEYLARVRKACAEKGWPDPRVVVDDARECRPAPILFEQRTVSAVWRRDQAPGCGIEDCPCEQDDSLPDDWSAQDRETFRSLDSREDWTGLLSLKRKGYEVLVAGLVFGNEFMQCEQAYVVAGPSARDVELFFSEIRHLAKAAVKEASKSVIFVSDSESVVRPSAEWSDVVLQASHRETIERNIDAFFKAKSAYHANKLAYRRGILMVGPPGNGKSSVIKVLAAQRRDICFFVYGFNDMGNDSVRIRRLFKKASDCSPSIVVLEDIDRLAHEDTLRAVLNILDGITSSNGVFVLATSNNAGTIDPALIERPSRFDLVLRFDNPARAQRGQYLALKLSKIGTPEQISALADETEGFSMAMLQELFAGAVLESVLGGREPTWAEVEVSHRRLKESLSTARKEIGKGSGDKVGFARKAGFGGGQNG